MYSNSQAKFTNPRYGCIIPHYITTLSSNSSGLLLEHRHHWTPHYHHYPQKNSVARLRTLWGFFLKKHVSLSEWCPHLQSERLYWGRECLAGGVTRLLARAHPPHCRGVPFTVYSATASYITPSQIPENFSHFSPPKPSISTHKQKNRYLEQHWGYLCQ